MNSRLLFTFPTHLGGTRRDRVRPIAASVVHDFEDGHEQGIVEEVTAVQKGYKARQLIEAVRETDVA